MNQQTLFAIVILAAVAVALAASLLAFLSLKREMAELGKQGESIRAGSMRVEELAHGEIARLEEELRKMRGEIRATIATAVPAPPHGSGLSMNLNKRSQALRMFKRGESLEHVASVLGVPRRELELLLKVQDALGMGLNPAA